MNFFGEVGKNWGRTSSNWGRWNFAKVTDFSNKVLFFKLAEAWNLPRTRSRECHLCYYCCYCHRNFTLLLNCTKARRRLSSGVFVDVFSGAGGRGCPLVIDVVTLPIVVQIFGS